MKQYLIFGIFLYISQRKHTTAKEIAEQFEISTRTVYRYIDALSCAGVPFITDVGKNGGISLDPNFTLENFLLSRQEKDALKDALSVNNISDNITLLINKLCV